MSANQGIGTCCSRKSEEGGTHVSYQGRGLLNGREG